MHYALVLGPSLEGPCTWERLATTGCYLVSQYSPTSTDVQSGAAGLATVQQPGDQMNTGQAEL